MRGIFGSRGIGFAVATLSLAVAGSFGEPANAQTSAVSSGSCPYWIDAKTGARVRTVPIGITQQELFDLQTGNHPNQAHGAGAHDYVKQPDGTWIDAATGNPVRTVPIGITQQELFDLQTGNHPNQAHGAGAHDYVLIPCPPTQTALSGLYLGGELVKNSGWVRSTERLATTDFVTNQFSDRADPVGGGFLVGYKFAPWAGNIVVSPFASFDFLRAPVNHTFAGGSFLGTTANFMGTGGVKIGPQLDMGLWLYGIAGVSVLNETLNVNFIPVASSRSATVAGGTVGVGGAWQPSFLQGFGRPVALFAEYQHSWWQDANFNTPTASPLFNYTFRRQDDLIKFGFTVSFNAPSVSVAPSYPVKALPAK